MDTVTLAEITENLRKLPADKLIVVHDFVSYLVAQETKQDASLPVAILVPMAEYERLTTLSQRKATFYSLAYHLGQEVEKQGLGEEEFMTDLEQTKRQVFAERYGRAA
jgi:hypothetical protein